MDGPTAQGIHAAPLGPRTLLDHWSPARRERRTRRANAVPWGITASSNSAEPAVFHEASGTIRFWVPVGDTLVGASVSPLALHYSYPPQTPGEDAMETFRHNLPHLEAVVRKRLASGAREPVMLREHDLRAGQD